MADLLVRDGRFDLFSGDAAIVDFAEDGQFDWGGDVVVVRAGFPVADGTFALRNTVPALRQQMRVINAEFGLTSGEPTVARVVPANPADGVFAQFADEPGLGVQHQVVPDVGAFAFGGDAVVIDAAVAMLISDASFDWSGDEVDGAAGDRRPRYARPYIEFAGIAAEAAIAETLIPV